MADAVPTDEQLGTAVLAALGRVIDPEIRRPVTELDMIRGVDVQPGGAVRVDLQLTIVGCPAADTIERDVRVAARSVPGVVAVDVDVSVMDPATRAALTERLRGDRPKGIQFTADSLT
ncbi:iron-sulfur cluster assembly protein, partial [Curtobacterium flaccumfaciens]|nr:iron-sulfur cluster assembly protein [Curtobacterium flaccumfaciens]